MATRTTFGNLQAKIHSKGQEILDGVSKRVKHSQKLRNVSLLSKGFAVATPRFGGRTVFLWVKNKTRVWIERTNVWVSFSTFPRTFANGILLQAEMYRDGDTWIVAFEDVIMMDGDDVRKPFLHRLPLLITLVDEMRRFADPSRDPGVYAVKPWFPVSKLHDELRGDIYRKQPQYLLVKFLPKSPRYLGADSGITQESFFLALAADNTSTSVTDHTSSTDTPEIIHSISGTVNMIRRIYKIREGDPDQYNLIDPATGESSGRACVRTLQCSLWLASLKDGAYVMCRNVSGHDNLEPYADGLVVCV